MVSVGRVKKLESLTTGSSSIPLSHNEIRQGILKYLLKKSYNSTRRAR